MAHELNGDESGLGARGTKRVDSGRRNFLKSGVGALGSAWLAVHWPAVVAAATTAQEAREDDAGFQVLSAPQAAALEAIAERIVPSGNDGPGAREAGVVHFMDAALGGFAAPMMAALQPGLEDLEARVSRAYPGSSGFAALDAQRQDAILRDIQDGRFFGLVRVLTLWGMFTLPSYGGNKDQAGWKMIGFRDPHGWQPPFGYYDEHYSEEGGDPHG